MSAPTVTPIDTTDLKPESGRMSPEDIQFVENFWEAEIIRDPSFAAMSEEEYLRHFEDLCSQCCPPEELGLDCSVNDLLCRSRQCSHMKPLTEREVGEILDELEKGLQDGTLTYEGIAANWAASHDQIKLEEIISAAGVTHQ